LRLKSLFFKNILSLKIKKLRIYEPHFGIEIGHGQGELVILWHGLKKWSVKNVNLKNPIKRFENIVEIHHSIHSHHGRLCSVCHGRRNMRACWSSSRVLVKQISKASKKPRNSMTGLTHIPLKCPIPSKKSRGLFLTFG
jgi:hypothetical protein